MDKQTKNPFGGAHLDNNLAGSPLERGPIWRPGTKPNLPAKSAESKQTSNSNPPKLT